MLAFVAVTAAYLIASMARLPRSGLAIAGGLVGVMALATLAAGSPTFSPLLFSVQLALAALALGAVNAAMLLGHWYLVTPKLSPTPLRRMMWLLLVALLLQVVIFVVAVVTVSSGPLGGPIGWLTWLRLAVGILLPIGITVLAILASRAPSLQASTGLLYIGLAFIMAGAIAGASITYLHRRADLSLMQVTVRTFAILRELSADRVVVELPPSARLEDAWAAMADRYPGLQAHRPFVRPARAGAYAAWDAPLAEGDEVAFLPPVSGGSTMTLTDGADRRGGPGGGVGAPGARRGRDLRRARARHRRRRPRRCSSWSTRPTPRWRSPC